MTSREPKKQETSFGIEQINNPTPRWANVVFGVIIILTTAISVWVAATSFITDVNKVEWLLIVKCIDIVIFGVAKLFGVDPNKGQS
jgi:hypothetical protein